MTFTTLTAMAVAQRFGARSDFVFDDAAKAAAIEVFDHSGKSLLE
jgi:hypothetical protein